MALFQLNWDWFWWSCWVIHLLVPLPKTGQNWGVKVNVFIAVNAKSPRGYKENFCFPNVALAQVKGRGTGCMASMASSPTWGAWLQPILIIGAAMNALKSAINCSLRKLTMCFHNYFPPKRLFFLLLLLCGFGFLLAAFDQFVHSVLSLYILPYSCSLFFERFTLYEEFNSRSQTGFTKGKRNKQWTRKIKRLHKLFSNLWTKWRGVFTGLSFFFSSSWPSILTSSEVRHL